MSNELQPVAKNDLALFQNLARSDDPLNQIQRMGEVFAASGMFGVSRVEQGVILAMTCVTHQMTPVEVDTQYHIIDGRLSKRSGAALAQFKAIGGKYEWIKTGQEYYENPVERVAVGRFELDGQSVEVAFSMQDALNAELVRDKSAWTKFPWKMLRARVISDALGMIAPEIYYGTHESEDSPRSGAPTQLFEAKSGEEPELKNVTPNQNETHERNEEPKSEAIDAELVDETVETPPARETKPKPARKTTRKATKKTAETKPASDSVDDRERESETLRDEKPRAGDAAIETAARLCREEDERERKKELEKKNDGKPRASAEDVDQVMKICRNDMDAAMHYLREMSFLKEGETLSDLGPAQAKQVIQYADRFLTAARNEWNSQS